MVNLTIKLVKLTIYGRDSGYSCVAFKSFPFKNSEIGNLARILIGITCNRT